ncbi:MAG: SCO1664 family protein [Actinomycetes bacterium]
MSPEASGTAVEGLLEGDLEIEGRILPASNATFLGAVVTGATRVRCVYKPVAGERPLWDFPDGTLARREAAAYVVSEALGWAVVPPTVLREGPAGPGMVQAWREPDPAQTPVDVVPRGSVPAGYRHVLDALDGDGEEVALVHEDTVALRRMAVFDVVVNNADRKGGHVLAMPDGHRHGVDHGVCFHVDDKLRTVLWGWATEPLPDADRPALERVRKEVGSGSATVGSALTDLLADEEIAALVSRVTALLDAGTMPLPSGTWPAIPWPAF